MGKRAACFVFWLAGVAALCWWWREEAMKINAAGDKLNSASGDIKATAGDAAVRNVKEETDSWTAGWADGKASSEGLQCSGDKDKEANQEIARKAKESASKATNVLNSAAYGDIGNKASDITHVTLNMGEDKAKTVYRYASDNTGKAMDNAAYMERNTHSYALEKASDIGVVSRKKAHDAYVYVSEKTGDGDARKYASEKAGIAFNAASKIASDVADDARKKAYDAYLYASEKARNAMNAAPKKAWDIGDDARKKAYDAYVYASEKARRAMNAASDSAGDDVRKKAYDAYLYAFEKAHGAMNTASDSASDDARKKANDVYLYASEKAHGAMNTASDLAGDVVKKKAYDAYLYASEKARDAMTASSGSAGDNVRKKAYDVYLYASEKARGAISDSAGDDVRKKAYDVYVYASEKARGVMNTASNFAHEMNENGKDKSNEAYSIVSENAKETKDMGSNAALYAKDKAFDIKTIASDNGAKWARDTFSFLSNKVEETWDIALSNVKALGFNKAYDDKEAMNSGIKYSKNKAYSDSYENTKSKIQETIGTTKDVVIDKAKKRYKIVGDFAAKLLSGIAEL